MRDDNTRQGEGGSGMWIVHETSMCRLRGSGTNGLDHITEAVFLLLRGECKEGESENTQQKRAICPSYSVKQLLQQRTMSLCVCSFQHLLKVAILSVVAVSLGKDLGGHSEQ